MAEVNIDVAKEASVQAVNTTVGTVNTSVQAVNTKVGTSGDTASNTPTTMFAGIKGLIAWFTGTWTAARAAKLDTLETLWTSTRASFIDTISSYVTGALYTNTARGSVKSVQRGTLTISDSLTVSVTISAVNTSKSVIQYLGMTSNMDSVKALIRLSLTNSTTVTAIANTGTATLPAVVSFEVIEFY